jgi:hypothetical protein
MNRHIKNRVYDDVNLDVYIEMVVNHRRGNALDVADRAQFQAGIIVSRIVRQIVLLVAA